MRSKGSHGVFAPTPFPSPAAGEGPSGQIAACSTRRLGSVTSCYRFAVTPHKMRRRHLESVSAAPYGSTFQLPLKSPIRIQPQLSGKGVLGRSPKCVLVPFTQVKGTPRRRAVQIIPLQKAPRRRQAKGNFGIICVINPSVTATPCQLPLHRGALGVGQRR